MSSTLSSHASLIAIVLLAATGLCDAREATPPTIVPYVVQGDEQATYQRAADLALLGRHKEAKAVVQPLIERGYPVALRYDITHLWDVRSHTPVELAAGCERRASGRSVPMRALERLALQGDQPAIDRYISCMTSNWGEMRRTDWNPRAALWLIEREARAGSWTRASDLFLYHLARMGLRTSPEGLAAKHFSDPKECGFRCRKPDLVAAGEVARLMESLAAHDEAILPSIYYESTETLTWAFLAREDDRQAAAWASITAERAKRAAGRSHPSSQPHLEQLRAKMLRVVSSIQAISDAD